MFTSKCHPQPITPLEANIGSRENAKLKAFIGQAILEVR
jgi:hypothetical protein